MNEYLKTLLRFEVGYKFD